MLRTIGFAGVALLLMVSLGYGRASIVDEGGRFGEYSSDIGSESDMGIWTPWKVLCDAARHGNAEAQFYIGLRYETGRGVAVDLRKATQCYRLAAERGLAVAQYNLGVAYSTGSGVPENATEAVKWYRQAAAQGYAAAQYNLGVMYGKGTGVLQDAREAVKWFRLAAAQELAEAQYSLGVAYSTGSGVPENATEAAKWYRLAAEQGHAEAQYVLGLMCAEGIGLPLDVQEAIKWFRLAAEQGHAEAQSKLGSAYATGNGVPENATEAVKWYRLAAEQGHAEAQYVLGLMCAEGIGLPLDVQEAIKWLRLAAEQGLAEAQCDFGVMYGNGTGVPQDVQEAVRWYRLAAAQGYAVAQNNIGVMYEKGTGVSQDVQEAVRWYRLAAAQGYAVAQNNLGVMYEKGTGVSQDTQEAVRWYRMAAEQEYAEAQYNLGVAYWNGTGLPQDAREAVKWYRLAVKQGLANAQNNLGVAYWNGRGVSKDTREAIEWFRLAAAQGYAEAQYNLGMAYAAGIGVPKDVAEARWWYGMAAAQGNNNAVRALASPNFVASSVGPMTIIGYAICFLLGSLVIGIPILVVVLNSKGAKTTESTRTMTFCGCYLQGWKKYADFSGRARRKELWAWVIINFAVSFVFGLTNVLFPIWMTTTAQESLVNAFGYPSCFTVVGLLFWIFAAEMFLPELALLARRYHDIGYSGWCCLFLPISKIPIILQKIYPICQEYPISSFLLSAVALVTIIALLIAIFKKGEPRENQYGPDPKYKRMIFEKEDVLPCGQLPAAMVEIPRRNFMLCSYEVTQDLWEAVMGGNPAKFKGAGRPVENVSWNDCQKFLEKLNSLPRVKESGLTYRLPTEEEWEYACRAGSEGDYCKLADGTVITKEILGRVAWYDGNSAGVMHPVGEKEPNAFGLYDVHGNVWEWTATADGDGRVFCGGGWLSGANRCVADARGRHKPDEREDDLGFRLAADVR